ncbi:MAG: tRNA uridine-5-carboxymethylaminomethyl(34) synthesis GTPase MnmE [Calditrichaceae bacterium]
MEININTDTIIAPITATVGGSVSLIRISGNQAISYTNQLFIGSDLSQQRGNKFFHGQLQKGNEIIDDVIILLYRSPNSYTSEDVVEISCHGNPFIVEKIIQLFIESGCRMADPGEFTKRAFFNGKIDLLQAEAVADLIAAKSLKSAHNSLVHIEGKISELIKSLKDTLIDTASLVTLDLDFSEDDLSIIDHSKIEETINHAQKIIDNLIKSYEYGRILNKGAEVIICGKPNVGKSSLMNALIKRDRVIVSSTPGTTRDTIHEDVIMDNISIRFIDTAGIRITNDEVEAKGVNRSEAAFDKADIILLIVDISEPLTQDDYNLIDKLKESYLKNLIIIGNKNDKKADKKSENELKKFGPTPIKISAKTGEQINLLEQEIITKLKMNSDILTEDIIITNQRQFDILNKTNNALSKAFDATKEKIGFEYIAVDIKNAIDLLSEITGEITSDDILNNIFSKFCIGK